MPVGSVRIEPSQGRSSGSRPGTVGLCHCWMSLLCLFLWMAQVIRNVDIPLFHSHYIPVTGVASSQHLHLFLPVVLYRAANQQRLVWPFPPFAKGLFLECCLDPLRKDGCFHTCSACWQGLCN